MKHHPEQQDDEIYMGNTHVDDVYKSSWKTVRLGEKPFMADGSPYIGLGYDLRPWFIQKTEVLEEIQKEREINNSWSADRIRGYEPIIEQGTIFIK